MKETRQPIDSVEWIEPERLSANDYNPNVVLDKELQLLAFSLKRQGWIQPILATKDGVIIDGYHRWWLSTHDKGVRALKGGKVPVVRLDMDEAERKLLTIRINRAKGFHQAFKMHEIVQSLISEHGLSVERICEEIGATKDEVELLMRENVFKVLDIEHHKYSKAWVPTPKKKAGKA